MSPFDGICTDEHIGLLSLQPVLACKNCLKESCCDRLDECARDASCRACLAGEACASSSRFDALKRCAHEACKAPCYPTISGIPKVACLVADLSPASGTCLPESPAVTCNPMVRSYDCNWQAGAACDFDVRHYSAPASGFACFASARNHSCESCGVIEGLCHYGLTCVNGLCARFCCDDLDCGPGSRCDPTFVSARLGSNPHAMGICVEGTP